MKTTTKTKFKILIIKNGKLSFKKIPITSIKRKNYNKNDTL